MLVQNSAHLAELKTKNIIKDKSKSLPDKWHQATDKLASYRIVNKHSCGFQPRVKHWCRAASLCRLSNVSNSLSIFALKFSTVLKRYTAERRDVLGFTYIPDNVQGCSPIINPSQGTGMCQEKHPFRELDIDSVKTNTLVMMKGCLYFSVSNPCCRLPREFKRRLGLAWPGKWARFEIRAHAFLIWSHHISLHRPL